MNPRFEQIEMRYKKRLMFASELHYIPGVIPSIGNKNKLTSSREIEKIISHDKICRGIPRKFYHRLKFSLWAKISAWRAAFKKYSTFETNVSLYRKRFANSHENVGSNSILTASFWKTPPKFILHLPKMDLRIFYEKSKEFISTGSKNFQKTTRKNNEILWNLRLHH